MDCSVNRIIISGSRDWTDPEPIRQLLIRSTQHIPALLVTHGAARGADNIADELARGMGIPTDPHPADWRGRGKAAGPLRNREMAELGAVACYCFKDGFNRKLDKGGTENMAKLAKEAGIVVWAYSDGEWSSL